MPDQSGERGSSEYNKKRLQWKPVSNGAGHDHVNSREKSDKEQQRENPDKSSAGKKYQIDDRQDQHGDKTYDRAHDIKWCSVLFGERPKSPKASELQASQLDEADGVLGDVF